MVTEQNTQKEKLIETYEGLPVINEVIVIETDENGQVTGQKLLHIRHRRIKIGVSAFETPQHFRYFG